ncbi:carboxymuconolactone decarboxylase family protein [Anseongella ginsenosidimutans]|uniref:carboxymuconolactone decarboxylase family protein n=1 Tax=Anseongella ginsenosidimutans TaxID=496056 RepID=UPI0037448497
MLATLMTMVAMFSTVNAQQKSKAEEPLSPKQESIIVIASYTAQGGLENLHQALGTGLDNGLTVNQIKEAIVHAYAYCGFPRSIRGLQTFMEVLDERKARGINDDWGPEASPIADERNKYERGAETLYELTGKKWDKPESGYGAFSPEIDRFLKEHLFADIFERDVLSYAERELVTVSVLSGIGGVEPMLRSHLNICLNVGLTPKQLQQFAGIIKRTIGKQEAKAVQTALDEVL